MINFPNYSDLGSDGISRAFHDEWLNMIQKVERCAYYYDGLVFEERVETEGDVEPDEVPLKYPARLNLVRSIVDALTQSAFGDFNELPATLAVRGDLEATDADREAIGVLSSVFYHSGGAKLFYEIELDRNLYGGAALEIYPVLSKPGVLFRKVSRFSFFPIWSGSDPDKLIEVNVVTYLTVEQAKAMFGTIPHGSGEYFLPLMGRIRGFIELRKRYLPDETIVYLNGKEVERYENPWGIVPFVYIPRYRAENWFGESAAVEVMGQQDELNAKVADIGDYVSYHAHPIRYGYNLPNNFNSRNYPLSADAFWNLGRALPGSPEPFIGVLESKNPINQAAIDYINFIYDWARTNNGAPPIAFGVDNGGGQRSSSTLEVRLWPIKRTVQMTRSYLIDGLVRAFEIAGIIFAQKQYPWCSMDAANAMIERRITCVFGQVLPRDFQKAVDDVVRLLSTNPPTISLETAISYLGFGKAEVERIRQMLADESLWREKSVRVPGPLSSSVHKEESIDQDHLPNR